MNWFAWTMNTHSIPHRTFGFKSQLREFAKSIPLIVSFNHFFPLLACEALTARNLLTAALCVGLVPATFAILNRPDLSFLIGIGFISSGRELLLLNQR